jgi:transcriptional regulator with XRE-family HTH domain
VTFAQKIERWTAENQRSRAQLAGNAGLDPSVLHNYVKRDSAPMAETALRVARAMKVPIDWLIDDAREEWPPPDVTKISPSAFSDQELMRELAIRWRNALLDLLTAMDTFEDFDWASAIQQAQRTPLDKPLPDDVRRAIALLLEVHSRFMRWRNEFDLETFCITHHDSLPGASLPAGQLDDTEIGFRFKRADDLPEARKLMEIVRDRPEYRDSGERQYVLAMQAALTDIYRRRAAMTLPVADAFFEDAKKRVADQRKKPKP